MIFTVPFFFFLSCDSTSLRFWDGGGGSSSSIERERESLCVQRAEFHSKLVNWNWFRMTSFNHTDRSPPSQQSAHTPARQLCACVRACVSRPRKNALHSSQFIRPPISGETNKLHVPAMYLHGCLVFFFYCHLFFGLGVLFFGFGGDNTIIKSRHCNRVNSSSTSQLSTPNQTEGGQQGEAEGRGGRRRPGRAAGRPQLRRPGGPDAPVGGGREELGPRKRRAHGAPHSGQSVKKESARARRRFAQQLLYIQCLVCI